MFSDRRDAGRRLSEWLEPLRGQDLVVLGLPRGGVPVAFEVAGRLQAPLDVIVVRKLGVPYRPELAMGAIGENGVRVLDTELIARAGVTPAEVAAVERRERVVLDERVKVLRDGRPALVLQGRIAVVVDDGLATGSTARAACRVAGQLGADLVVLAVPVGPARTLEAFPEADAVATAHAPKDFEAVSRYYQDFSPTSDHEVVRLLAAAQHALGIPPGA